MRPKSTLAVCAALALAAACRFPAYRVEEGSRAGAGGVDIAPALGGAGSGTDGGLDRSGSMAQIAGAEANQLGGNAGNAATAGNGGGGSSGGGVSGVGGDTMLGVAGDAQAGEGAGGTPAEPRCADLPISKRSSWKAYASHAAADAPVTNLVDGTASRWTTAKAQTGNEWFKVDFGREVTLSQVNLQQGQNSNDYPRSYRVYVSSAELVDGSPVLASGSGQSGVTTTVKLAKLATGRYLMVKQVGTSLSWWSAEELEVSCIDF